MLSLAPILAHYPRLGSLRQILSLEGAGGFSGSRIWRLETDLGRLCLRRWPRQHPSESRLRLIHQTLLGWGGAGASFIPTPFATLAGTTFVSHADHFWELTPWMPGQADFHTHPASARLHHALQAVARLHVVSSKNHPATSAPAPAIVERHDKLCQLLSGGIETITAALPQAPTPRLRELGRSIIAQFHPRAPEVVPRLHSAASLSTELFPVIRDLWHDHVLFTGDEVTGIIDFGALRVDTPACDLARLLGSLVENDRDRWRLGLAAYEEIRPLSPQEHLLIPLLDESQALLSGLYWLEWLCLERRAFPDLATIESRLEKILQRLKTGPKEQF